MTPEGRREIHVRAERAVVERRWYRLQVKVDVRKAALNVSALTPLPGETEADAVGAEGCDLRAARHVLLAAAALDEHVAGRPVFPYNGKLERLVLSSSAGLLAEWAFELTPSGDRVEDISGRGAHGLTINAPARLMTGSTWDGSVQDPRLDPRGHAAIHFHADDIDDARWRPTARIELPADLPSGIYAVRLRALGGQLTDLVPFAVVPDGKGRPPRYSCSQRCPTKRMPTCIRPETHSTRSTLWTNSSYGALISGKASTTSMRMGPASAWRRRRDLCCNWLLACYGSFSWATRPGKSRRSK